MTVEVKYAPLPHWCLISGMTRTASYQGIAEGHLRAIKQPGGRRTLVDVQHGLAWLGAQPSVDLRSGKRRDAQQAAA